MNLEYYCTYQTNQATEEDEEESGDSVDSRGIPGWDRVDKLAAALLALRGLCVTNAQAAEIQVLYRNLLEYDKKPLTYPPRSLKPPQGRFARSKSKSHIGVDHMKKYIAFLCNCTNKHNIDFIIGVFFRLGIQPCPLPRVEWWRLSVYF